MNLQQFLEDICSRIRFSKSNEIEVVIPVGTFNGSCGPKSAVEVKSTNIGIDWDNGRYFINPGQELMIEDKETKLAKKFLHKCISALVNAKRTGDNKQLTRSIRGHFDDIIKELDIEENIDKVIAETNELAAKARHVRKLHATRKEILEE
jgi:hypothetical protein